MAGKWEDEEYKKEGERESKEPRWRINQN